MSQGARLFAAISLDFGFDSLILVEITFVVIQWNGRRATRFHNRHAVCFSDRAYLFKFWRGYVGAR
jgi:hypothetical protein